MSSVEKYIELEWTYKAAQRRLFHTKPLDPDRLTVLAESERAYAALVQFERDNPELSQEIWDHCQQTR